ncbi:MAG: permease, partial [Planctomycetota bacterium]
MTALLVSIALLLLGPLLLWAARRQPILLAILDGFTLFAVGGLVCLDILPHALEQAGLWTVPLALAGLFVPTAFERLKSRGAARAHALALILGMIGVASHALMDGAALSGGRAAPGLLLAVVLPRQP